MKYSAFILTLPIVFSSYCQHKNQNKPTFAVHMIVHKQYDMPNAIGIWAEKHGYTVDYTRPGQALPTDTKNFDFLVVMGGPQSTRELPEFHADREAAFMQNAIADNKLVLGVCLGIQLLSMSYGARAEKSPYREIGVFPITLTDAAKNDPIFCNFPKTFPVGLWHDEMAGLPANATVLAQSAGCPRQIIRYDKYVYGFQCHFEFNKGTIQTMMKKRVRDLKNPDKFVQPSILLSYDYEPMNKLLWNFLDQITVSYRQANPTSSSMLETE